MARASTLLLGAAAAVLFVTTALVAAPDASRQQAPATPEEDQTYPLFVQTCNECHDAQRIIAARRTRMEWEDIVQKMIEKGAKGTGDDFERVYGFLVRHFGKVYINNAVRDDITMTIGLSAKDADAILAHRTAHGPFADLEAVKKVPGIDAKAIDDHKDAIAF